MVGCGSTVVTMIVMWVYECLVVVGRVMVVNDGVNSDGKLW